MESAGSPVRALQSLISREPRGMFDISPELRAAAAVAAAKRARQRRAFGAPTARPGRAQRALGEQQRRVRQAGRAAQAGRRGGKAEVLISSWLVSFHSPRVRPYHHQNRRGSFVSIGGVLWGGITPLFAPLLATRGATFGATTATKKGA